MKNVENTGTYRFVWRDPNGTEMGMGGVYREIVPPERLVATELFDDPWYEGEALDTTVLVEQGGKTTVMKAMMQMNKLDINRLKQASAAAT